MRNNLRLKKGRNHTFVLDVLSAVCGGKDYVQGRVVINDVVVDAVALFDQSGHPVSIKSSDMLHRDVQGGLQRVAVHSFPKDCFIQAGAGMSSQLKLVGWAELNRRLLEKYGWKVIIVSICLRV